MKYIFKKKGRLDDKMNMNIWFCPSWFTTSMQKGFVLHKGTLPLKLNVLVRDCSMKNTVS